MAAAAQPPCKLPWGAGRTHESARMSQQTWATLKGVCGSVAPHCIAVQLARPPAIPSTLVLVATCLPSIPGGSPSSSNSNVSQQTHSFSHKHTDAHARTHLRAGLEAAVVFTMSLWHFLA